MIIKITFNDNDFTSVIEEFLDKWKQNSFMYDVLNDMDEYERNDETGKYIDASHVWRERNDLLHKDKYDDIDVCNLLNAFRISFSTYLEDNYCKDALYLIGQLKVRSVKSIKDQWLNGEVVYYFPKRDKYITM